MQSSRVGDVDSFAILYLMEQEGYSIEEMRRILLKESGLKGVSGTSGDMRDMREAAAKGSEASKIAIDAFVYDVRQYIGAYSVALQGLDVLTFAGGIGEKGSWARTLICQGMEFLGLKLDEKANDACFATEQAIHAQDSRVQIWVVPTNEELIVARETRELLGNE